jgi:hypothetical protein
MMERLIEMKNKEPRRKQRGVGDSLPVPPRRDPDNEVVRATRKGTVARGTRPSATATNCTPQAAGNLPEEIKAQLN